MLPLAFMILAYLLDCLVQTQYEERCLMIPKFDMLCLVDIHGRPAFSERKPRNSGCVGDRRYKENR